MHLIVVENWCPYLSLGIKKTCEKATQTLPVSLHSVWTPRRIDLKSVQDFILT